MKCRVHSFVSGSRANGPGRRAVVWLQGCSLGCPGCFNPATHTPEGGSEVEAAELALRIRALGKTIDGVTFSGGEPLEQAAALLEVLGGLGPNPPGVLVYTGFTLPEVRALPQGPRILASVDALIAGRYVASLNQGRGFLGSSNQELVLLSPRYRREDFERAPIAEVHLQADGNALATGIRRLALEEVRDGQ